MLFLPFRWFLSVLVLCLVGTTAASTCIYDSKLLAKARSQMASRHYEDVLALSQRVLHCSSGMSALTQADLRRMRIRALSEHFEAVQQVQASVTKASLDILTASLSEQQAIRAFLRQQRLSLKHHEQQQIDTLLRKSVAELHAGALSLTESDGIDQAMPYLEVLVSFLSGLQGAGSEMNKLLAELGSVVGQYYLDRNKPDLAEQFFVQAFRMEDPISDYSAVNLSSKIAINPKKASTLFYNLAGIYHQRLVRAEPLSASQRSVLAPPLRQKRAMLARKIGGLYQVSYRLNPDNQAAKLAAEAMQEYKP